MKRKTKIICIILIIIFVVGAFLVLNKIITKNYTKVDETLSDNNVDFTANITTRVKVPDEDIPNDVDVLNMTEKEKLYGALILETFENGKNLTTEQYLKVAYNAINQKYVKISKETNSNTYTEEEINNIVYTIFGVELSENKSIQGLKYENGTYQYVSNNTEKYNVPIIEKLEEGAAAGTIYAEFELYYNDMNGNKNYKGKYKAAIGQNTETGERFIKSISKN